MIPVVFVSSRFNRGAGGGSGGSNRLLEIALAKHDSDLLPKFIWRKEHDSNLEGRASSWIDLFCTISACPANAIYVCHDLASSIIPFILGRKYIVAYHQQGSLLEELRSFQKRIGLWSRIVIPFLEVVGLVIPKNTIFMSRGAIDAFVRTSPLHKSLKRKIARRAVVIYNTCYTPKPSTWIPDLIQIAKGKAHGRKIVLTISTLSELKGVDRIPSFISNNKTFQRDFFWICVGEGPLQHCIEESVSRFGLENCVYLINRFFKASELQHLYQASKYYLMLHRISIFDKATLEAMSYGLIPILSNVGGNKEMNIEDNIIFVNDNESIQMPNKEMELVLAQKNRHVFNKHFSMLQLAKAYNREIVRAWKSK